MTGNQWFTLAVVALAFIALAVGVNGFAVAAVMFIVFVVLDLGDFG
jgi:hypothetical protein